MKDDEVWFNETNKFKKLKKNIYTPKKKYRSITTIVKNDFINQNKESSNNYIPSSNNYKYELKEREFNNGFFSKKKIRQIKFISNAATLDLHGLTTTEAKETFIRFILKCYNNNIPLVLVITGKGKKNKNSSINLGVLYNSFFQWVLYDIITEKIISFTHAKQQHGGNGAFYIALKQK